MIRNDFVFCVADFSSPPQLSLPFLQQPSPVPPPPAQIPPPRPHSPLSTSSSFRKLERSADSLFSHFLLICQKSLCYSLARPFPFFFFTVCHAHPPLSFSAFHFLPSNDTNACCHPKASLRAFLWLKFPAAPCPSSSPLFSPRPPRLLTQLSQFFTTRARSSPFFPSPPLLFLLAGWLRNFSIFPQRDETSYFSSDVQPRFGPIFCFILLLFFSRFSTSHSPSTFFSN